MNKTLKEYFEEVLNDYEQASKVHTTTNEIPRLKNLINGQKGLIPKFIKVESRLIDYTVKGSIGQGNITPFPWVCIFDNEITKSAQRGYYLVYLFKEDMSGFYLSLNQGWEQYNKLYKDSKVGLRKINENAQLAMSILRTVKNLKTGSINIKGNSNRIRERGYENGNIAAIYYDFKNIPDDDVLFSDLNKMLSVYSELKSLVGSNILKISKFKYFNDVELDEQEYQQKSNKRPSSDIPRGPQQKREIKDSNKSTSKIPRDPNIAAHALNKANYKCEINPNHQTFISRTSNQNFVEAHHLIPMNAYDDFEFSIDIPENIISLCPNCHRLIHHGEEQKVNEILITFFDLRISGLIDRDINLSKKDLLRYYHDHS